MVYATESRPKLQGRITAKQLAERKVPVTYIVDSAMRYFMKDVDLVIVGADTIASNGAVINKIGTSQLALIAHERRVPFIVCAETYKFSPQTFHGSLVTIEERDPSEVLDRKEFPGVKVANPVFDATPAEYIDAIVTELGVIPPSAAYEIVVSNFGIDALRSMDAKEWMIDDLE
jgi:ribose 1,5-bisphosphate isomerase